MRSSQATEIRNNDNQKVEQRRGEESRVAQRRVAKSRVAQSWNTTFPGRRNNLEILACKFCVGGGIFFISSSSTF